MKLIIIYPDILKGANWKGYFYTGVGYLSAVAKQAGHEVALIHITQPVSQKEFLAIFEKKLTNDPHALIAFSSTTNMFTYTKEWSAWIKKYHQNIIIAGGVHTTLNPQSSIEVPSIDAICIGEGEYPLLNLMNALASGGDVTTIASIWIKKDGKVYQNPLRPLIEDLAELPFPDRGIFDYKNLELERQGIGVVLASRGCPYNCYYCCNHALKKQLNAMKGYMRFRSVSNVLAEIKQMIRDYPFINFIHFDDDILPIDMIWFEEFATRYKNEINLPFECNIRPNLVHEDSVRFLKEAGCITIRLGLESGNSHIRNKILNRSLSEETIIKASELCKRFGIRVYTFNMVGLPEENMLARLDTIKLNARIDSDEEQVSIFYPFEKTKLYDICQEQGLLQKKEVTDIFRNTSLTFSWSEEFEILFTAYLFTILVRLYKTYYRFPKVAKNLTAVTDFILTSWFASHVFYPLVVTAMKFIMRHKHLEQFARSIKRTFLRTVTN